MRYAALVVVLTALQLAPTSGAAETRENTQAVMRENQPSELLERPEDYLGKSVRVRGVIVAVGPKSDPWMDIANDLGGDRIRIKANDKATILPMEAKGTQVIAEGVFTKIQVKGAPNPKKNDEEKAVVNDAAPSASLDAEVAGLVPPPTDEYQILVTAAGVKKP